MAVRTRTPTRARIDRLLRDMRALQRTVFVILVCCPIERTFSAKPYMCRFGDFRDVYWPRRVRSRRRHVGGCRSCERVDHLAKPDFVDDTGRPLAAHIQRVLRDLAPRLQRRFPTFTDPA